MDRTIPFSRLQPLSPRGGDVAGHHNPLASTLEPTATSSGGEGCHSSWGAKAAEHCSNWLFRAKDEAASAYCPLPSGNWPPCWVLLPSPASDQAVRVLSCVNQVVLFALIPSLGWKTWFLAGSLGLIRSFSPLSFALQWKALEPSLGTSFLHSRIPKWHCCRDLCKGLLGVCLGHLTREEGATGPSPRSLTEGHVQSWRN